MDGLHYKIEDNTLVLQYIPNSMYLVVIHKKVKAWFALKINQKTKKTQKTNISNDKKDDMTPYSINFTLCNYTFIINHTKALKNNFNQRLEKNWRSIRNQKKHFNQKLLEVIKTRDVQRSI